MGFLDKLKELVPKTANKKENLAEKTYECPHCFKEITPNEVHFRLGEHVGSTEIDKQLQVFLAEVNLDTAQANKHGVIIPQENQDYEVITQNGVWQELKHKTTGDTVTQKLCPYCHNDLPTSFGHAVLIKISFFGATNVGKTMYMYRLFDVFKTIVSRDYAYSFQPLESGNNIEDLEKSVKKHQEEAATATAKGAYLPPKFYDLNCGARGRYICAIYDVAGEDTTTNDAFIASLKGRRLSHSDGLLFLLHPDQESHIKPEDGDMEDGGIDAFALNRMAIASLNKLSFSDRFNQTKLAVIVNKTDRIREELLEEDQAYSVLFRDSHKVLQSGELEQVNELTKKYLSDIAIDQVTNLNNLDKLQKHYFAVSTLGSDDRKKEDGTQFANRLRSIRLADPFLWLLKENGVPFEQEERA